MVAIRKRAGLVACEMRSLYNAEGKSSPSLAMDLFRRHNCLLLLLKLTDKTYDAKKAHL